MSALLTNLTTYMLTLYYKPTCPYCQKVLAEAELLGVSFNLKDITSDSVLANELNEKGGKDQVPYLIDDEKGEAMYESEDIVKYLQNNYGDGPRENKFGGLRIHRSDESCDTCQ